MIAKYKIPISGIIFVTSLILLIAIMPSFEKDMKNRPVYEKLGYVPTGKIIKMISGELRWFLGEYYTFKAIIYYGDLKGKELAGKKVSIEYYNLYKIIETAVILNPYHEDAYYFAQAAFTWDIGRVREVNAILRYVFQYRRWDFKIPFFLGFNYSYFLREYGKAAEYYKKAAEISGNPFFASLAARYFYESGHTKLGIIFLKFMIKGIRKKELKNIYEKRLKALEAIYSIEKAVKKYKALYGRMPGSIAELVKKGLLKSIPKDPYGGRFYIDKYGRVRSTSNLKEKKNVRRSS